MILSPNLNTSMLATEFWTSGWSGKCSATFIWCAHDELVDFRFLSVTPPQTNKSNECLFVTMEKSGDKNTTNLMLKGGDCMQKRRAICQVFNITITVNGYYLHNYI